jgi:hypothetical protein
VEVEAQESIHNHNAWAWQSENKLVGDKAWKNYLMIMYNHLKRT